MRIETAAISADNAHFQCAFAKGSLTNRSHRNRYLKLDKTAFVEAQRPYSLNAWSILYAFIWKIRALTELDDLFASSQEEKED